MAAKERQSVNVKIGPHYSGANGNQTITRVRLPRESVGQLIDILLRAERDGLGVNKHGEYELHLTRYSKGVWTKGSFGVVRIGATKRQTEEVVTSEAEATEPAAYRTRLRRRAE